MTRASGILTCGSVAVCRAPSLDTQIEVTCRRLPAYSGATVPVFNRLPVRASGVEVAWRRLADLPGVSDGECRLPAPFALVAVLALTACATAPAPAHIPIFRCRIVSLIPSLTEDLFAIGAGPAVVGVSAYDRLSAGEAAKLPVVATYGRVRMSEKHRDTLHPDVVVGIASQTAAAADARQSRACARCCCDDDGFRRHLPRYRSARHADRPRR